METPDTTRTQLESAVRLFGIEPSPEDNDFDLWLILKRFIGR